MSDPSPGVDGFTWDSAYHAPVLAREVVDLLGGRASVLDGTLGGGGHALALLEAGGERLIGIDPDPPSPGAPPARLSPFPAPGRLYAFFRHFPKNHAVPGPFRPP